MTKRILVSTRKGLFALHRGARGWLTKLVGFPAENVTLALPDSRDGGWYAALNLGHFGVKLKYSPDGGKTWEERAVPEYPEGEEIVTADGKPPAPATLKLIWALEAGSAAQPGRLWAGTLPGGLFRSDDGGKSWELNRPLWDDPRRKKWFGGGADFPGIHSLCRDPRSDTTWRLAVSCGGVWITEDDGARWKLIGQGIFADFMPPEQRFDPVIQDVHMMVQCPGDPNGIWVQHHNGIFRSTDGGENFTHVANAKPSGFGFAVAVHPTDPNTAWFVPAKKDESRIPVDGKLVVSRTRDGGQTFELLTKGLPKAPAYDLVYRHALAIDDTGKLLAFGSTTGGLWITEDGGDSWKLSKTRFPPIYAVRFA